MNGLNVELGVKCGECGAPMELRKSSRYKSPFWGCSRFPACRGTHGAHPNGVPLGIPANKETKQARIKAHDAFDRIWKDGHMPRWKAYKWLAKQMGVAEWHFGESSVGECNRAIEVIEAKLKELER